MNIQVLDNNGLIQLLTNWLVKLLVEPGLPNLIRTAFYYKLLPTSRLNSHINLELKFLKILSSLSSIK